MGFVKPKKLTNHGRWCIIKGYGGKNIFVPHSDLSSRVDLDVALSVITKTRPGRSVGNLLNEVRALRVWDVVLTAYNLEVGESAQIASPKLISFEPSTRSLQMTFRPGVHLGRVIVGDHDFKRDSLLRATLRNDIAFRLGSLAGLKTTEGFVHGDFQQRHLLENPLIVVDDPRRMSVIDVESSCPTREKKRLFAENNLMLDWFMKTVPKWQKRETNEAYHDGFSVGRTHAPKGVLRHAIREALLEVVDA